MTLSTPAEHPFAPFVRILAKGKRGARSLTQEEAAQAMAMLLDGQVEDTQLGAFLMLLRYKEESAEELAGFVEAIRQRLPHPSLSLDFDWPSYAGKKRHLPWYLLSAKLLAQAGYSVFMHGAGAHTAGRLYSEELLAALEIPQATDWQAAGRALEQQRLCFMPLQHWMPSLQRMIDLRNTLGLRSPVHSLVRLINPLRAACNLQSIFHPGYQAVHCEASRLLGEHAWVIKGDGGEIEIRPDTDAVLLATRNGHTWEEQWPALSRQRLVKPERLEPQQLLALWRGERHDEYGELAVISTLGFALHARGLAPEEALEQARQLWASRHA